MKMLALSMLLAVGCGSDPEAAAEVAGARHIGYLDESAAIQGRDGGESGLAFGRSVFAFGDTILNIPDASGDNWHHNSFAVSEDDDASDGIGPLLDRPDSAGAPQYLIVPTASEAAFNAAHHGEACAEAPCGARYAAWPGAPVWDPVHERALIFYTLIYGEPGAFNFHGVGASLAVWSDFAAAPERPIVSPDSAHPTAIWPEGELAPGIGSQIVGDELYSFGCREAFLSRPCVLFAAPLERVLEHDAWRVYDGSGWSSNPADAVDLFDGAPMMSVHWNDYVGAYVAVYSELLSNRVVMRTAPALTGPWSQSVRLFDAERQDGWTYDAHAHAELAEARGRILYVTYSQPTGETIFSSRFPIVRVVLDEK